ncbi:MAG: Holliday junction branch migration protein RuvA [Acidimicrobiia bacterium]
MIGRLRGTLAAVMGDRLIVDVAGVGYEVHVPTRGVTELPGVGEEVVLHTHLHVREDALTLFGFPSERGLTTFRLLLAAPGVGPRVALAVLSTLDPDAVTLAIAEEDITTLASVPGIGKRTAQKMVLELKPKVSAAEVAAVGSSGALTEVRLALGQLGYSDAEVAEVLPDVDPATTPEEQLRAALRSLAGRRRG